MADLPVRQVLIDDHALWAKCPDCATQMRLRIHKVGKQHVTACESCGLAYMVDLTGVPDHILATYLTRRQN